MFDFARSTLDIDYSTSIVHANVFHSSNAVTVRCTIEITTMEITITRTRTLTIAT